MKTKEVEEKFDEFVKQMGYAADRSRWVSDGKHRYYHTAKPGTVFLQWADARIGRRVRIGVNGESGTVSSFSNTGYISYSELYQWMDGVLWQFLQPEEVPLIVRWAREKGASS